MSLKVSELVWKHSAHKGSERLVLLAIARYAHDDGTGAYPSLRTLADDTRMSVRSVQYAIHDLIRGGELEVDIKAGPNQSNVFTILIGRWCNPLRDEVVQNMTEVVQDSVQGGAKSGMEVVQPASPKPLLRTVKEPSKKERERAREVQPQLFRPVPKAESARAPTPIPSSRAPNRPHSLPADFLDGTGLLEWATHEAKTHDAALNTHLFARKFLNYYSTGGKGASERLTDEEWEAKWRQWTLDEIDRLLQKGHTQTKAQGSTNGQNKRSRFAEASDRAHRELFGTGLDEAYDAAIGRKDANYQATAFPQLPQPPKTA